MFSVGLKWTPNIQSCSKGFKPRHISSLELKTMWENPEEKSKVSRSLINEYFKSELNLPLPTNIISPPISYSLRSEFQDWLERIKCLENGDSKPSEFKYNKLEWHVRILASRYGLNYADCVCILQNMESKDVQPDLSMLECMIQSILETDGILKGMEFIQSSYHLHYQHLTINILVMLSQAAIKLGDMELHKRFFTLLRKNWSLIPRNAYTYLFAAHLDLIIRFQRKALLKSELDKISSKTNPKTVLKSLEWIMKHQSMLEMRMDSEQYHIIIMGLAQGGFVEQALDYYHRYIAHGNQPTQSMLDIMMNNVCNLEPEGLINSILFDQPKNAKMVQQYFFQQYQKHGLEPFVGSYVQMLIFFNKTDKTEFQVVYDHSQNSKSEFTRRICTEVYEALDAGNPLRKNLLYIFSKDKSWSLKSILHPDDSVLCAIPNELQTLTSYAIYSKEKGLSGENIDLETSIINTRHGIRGAINPTSLESIQYYLKHR